ncbi:ABC transporter permease subunit [Alteromonas pelagimontana]|uniref:ABC transporter permease subunit n=1 Tax=Alteromonas pelagimontana TaxID=1858656 RepID=A0A6M4MC35_9ALTE|nr:ABC transporter permease subunit [Alteromonas pelagimontana]QJR80210.1 ABC transporter permease subunit [Alteromonas pelagimontana]
MKSPTTQRHKQRQQRDTRLRIVVTAFGALVLLTLLILIAHLVSQATPLALRPTLTLNHHLYVPAKETILATADVAEGEPLIIRSSDCRISLKTLVKNTLTPFHDYIRPCQYALKVISAAGQNYIVDISPAGLVRVVAVRTLRLQNNIPDNLSSLVRMSAEAPVVSFAVPEAIWKDQQSWSVFLSDEWAVISITTPDNHHVRWINRQNPTKIIEQNFPVDLTVLPLPGTRQTAVLTPERLSFVDIQRGLQTSQSLKEPIVWWQSLPKDRTLLTASGTGEITRWILRNEGGKLVYSPTYRIHLADKEVPLAVRAHASSNALALLTNNQRLLILNRVTGEIVSSTPLPQADTGLAWFGRKIYSYNSAAVSVWKVNYLSGITTWASLFEPQIYEGYDSQQTVWQTSSASDYQEEKYSLIPLLVGSLKASLLALFIAIPVALGAAVYSAYFAHAKLRQWIKPTIEMLEAIPSVLIGFIAAIWLAPMAEQLLFSLGFFLVILPLILFFFALLQHRLSHYFPKLMKSGTELLFVFFGVLLLGFISMKFAPQWIQVLADFIGVSSLTADSDSPLSKTTVVVAIALGIAISPSIYSLTEDAISGVPEHLKHASFALGATRLQTLHRVVLQVALPGILAAIMLGFGRAFGETMILLMVTGNTPVSSWSLLEGLRALTANLAIELPEADVGSIHYQILFFTACILFAFTFIVNTFAELLRHRLRKNAHYG